MSGWKRQRLYVFCLDLINALENACIAVSRSASAICSAITAKSHFFYPIRRQKTQKTLYRSGACVLSCAIQISTEGDVIRTRFENTGGLFPGEGKAPSMSRDMRLPPDGRASFERLNDEAAMRPSIMDAGSLVAANDNRAPKTPTPLWTAKELRLTRAQADFLSCGMSSVHQRVNDRTEISLRGRAMLAWTKGNGGCFYLGATPKGQAALKRHEKQGESK